MSNCDRAVIIGVSYNPNDRHILEAVQRVSGPLLYVGGKEDFEKWRATNNKFEHAAETFEKGFAFLIKRLGLPEGNHPT